MTKTERLAALKTKRKALEAKLKEKEKELKEICIKEGELIGKLPPEMPLAPGEPVPQIRPRVGTAFALSGTFFKNPQSQEKESLAYLELVYENQSKITSAAQELASDRKVSKSVQKKRKSYYQENQRKLQEMKDKMDELKSNLSKIEQLRRPIGQDTNVLPSNHQQHLHTLRGRSNFKSLRGTAEQRKRGKSVPNLSHASDQEDYDDQQGQTNLRSAAYPPKSYRSLPRKPTRKSNASIPSPQSPHQTDKSLKFSPALNRSPMTPASSSTPILAKAAETMNTSSSHTSERYSLASSVSPLRNKYEMFNQPESQVGLQNYSQQSRSQASSSSFDDLNVLMTNHRPLFPKPGERSKEAARKMRYPIGLEAAAARNAFPSLERSSKAYARKSQSRDNHPSRELPPPLLPPQSWKYSFGFDAVKSKKGQESLESPGLRRSLTTHSRDVRMNGDTIPDMFLNKLNPKTSQTQFHDLQDNKPSPANPRPGSLSTTSTSTSSLGTLHPVESRGPYPESSMKPLLPITSVQDVIFNHCQSVSQTISSSKPPTGKMPERPPPLFPKKYPQAVEQKSVRDSDELPNLSVPPRSVVNKSPSVNRRVKPMLPTSPMAPPLPPISSSHVARQQQSQSLQDASSNPSKTICVMVTTAPTAAATTSVTNGPRLVGKFVSFRETSKPFETSDVYKYSVKHRKASTSSLQSLEGDTNHGSDHQPNFSRKSIARRASSTTRIGQGHNSNIKGNSQYIGGDFSNKMMGWYNNNGQIRGGKDCDPHKPPTIV